MTLQRLLLLGSLAIVPTLQAENLSTTPTPGLWINESTTLINGIDMQARMREMRTNMLNSLPPEQRAMAEEMLGSEGQVGERQCITADAAKTLTDPEALLRDAKENMPNCDLEITQSSADTLQFTGRCNDPDGFTGDMNGTIEMISSTEMRSTFNGQGAYSLPAGLLSQDAGASNGDVTLSHQQVSRWQSSDCGNAPTY